MDKKTAIKISKNYLNKIKKNNILFSEAYLFGSYAKGKNKENSDIDIAIVLIDNSKTFETEVQLMVLRSRDEIIIEPHAFNKDDFKIDNPIVYQIVNYGMKINI